jgi:hypothetical protein
MNGLLWIAQIMLAGAFLFTGVTKLLAYNSLVKTLEGDTRRKPINMSRGQASLIGCVEIAGAVALVLPAAFTPPVLAPDYLLIRLAAGGLALLMVAAGIYHLVRKEPAAPAVVLFLLALFIIVGRWPH